MLEQVIYKTFEDHFVFLANVARRPAYTLTIKKEIEVRRAMESGNIAGAQSIILDEIKRQHDRT